MKALIYNSGIGHRMGELTAHCPKSMVHLYNDETIFERQIRLLQEAGVREVIITTGPYPEMLKSVCNQPRFGNMSFTFVQNEVYDKTNYIYSLYKARDYIDDDFITLHGDLVFDRETLPSILRDKRPNLILINKLKALPPKDFKGRIRDGKLLEVGVNIFDDDCYALQPIYKLDKSTFRKWIDKVVEFVEAGNVNVYAENALNEIASGLNIEPFSYVRHFVDEIDNPDDLARVSAAIEQFDFKLQKTYTVNQHFAKVQKILEMLGAKKPMIVSDPFFAPVVKDRFPEFPVFSEFTPNPKYEEVVEGLRRFKQCGCDVLISIGGGSCIDVAKTIKLCLGADPSLDVPMHRQVYVHTPCSHICLPTTSGTGSEATRHAVIYYDGVKQSICNSAILPDYVILSWRLVISAPRYQKICTCLDALCQCMESTWSRKATATSKRYAREGIRLFAECYQGYIEGNYKSVWMMQKVANLSGKAINISETTAAHALSYKVTSLYGVPHGHAVAMCMNALYKLVEFRHPLEYEELFQSAIGYFKIDLAVEDKNADSNLEILVGSVNPARLANFPKRLSPTKIALLYRNILLSK